MKRHHLLGLATFLLATAPGLSHGYELRTDDAGRRLLWGKRSLEVTIDAGNANGLPGAADEVRAAFATWLAAGVPFEVGLVEQHGGVEDGRDGKNVVSWVKRGWRYGPEVVGITVAVYRANTGVVLETDMLFNRQHHKWSTGAARAGHFDLRNVATHEVGHFFGLGHSSVEGATMWAGTPAGQQAKRTLHADDRLAIGALIEAMEVDASEPVPEPPRFGVSSTSGPTRPADRPFVGCSVGGEAPSGAILVLIALALLRRRRRFLAAWIICAGLVFTGGTASATTVKYLQLEELTRRANVVTSGRVVALRAVWEREMIYTDVSIADVTCIKGRCSGDETLRIPGGRLGQLVMHVPGAPRFVVGEHVVLYARRAQTAGRLRVVGLAQGAFHVRGNRLMRDLRGLCLLGPHTEHVHRGLELRSPSELGLGHLQGLSFKVPNGKAPN